MKKTLLLTLLTIAGLLSLYYLPEIHIWQGETLRKVNLLADVRKMTYSKNESEKLIAEAERERKQLLGQDTIPPGVTPIEDFSAMDSIRIMDGFYKKLNNIHTMTRPMRIAYYGDSFIEGDILTCDLRELLQNKYGGCGVGAVNIIYPFSYARGTILQSEEGLTEHVSSNPKQFKKELQGLNNFYATADSIASAKFQGISP
ncbi:MAG: hypothetical protein HUK08_07275, partial [Bacteroidaceae bacterium]|nr:hypothetical protein [Bacteroidaceae bacterium]